MKPKSLGQIAFEAYYGSFCLWRENKNKYWWNKTARAVAREVRRRDKVRRKRK